VNKTSWILVFTLVAISCLDQPDCYNLTNGNITIGFRKIADGRVDTVMVLERFFQSKDLDNAFINTDTVIVNGTSLQFPIDYLTNETNYSIKEIEKTNILELGYKVQTQFVSEECGPRFFVSDLTVLSSDTDSVRITSGIPGSGTNVTIYRCPRTNLAKIAIQTAATITNSTLRRDTINILSSNVNHPLTLLYPITGELSFLKLPLDLAANTTQVDFVLEGDLQRSITFQYDLVPATRYAICGQQTFITNLRIAETNFDDLREITTTRYKADSIYDPPRINFAIIQ
jgi:hypothetical protein